MNRPLPLILPAASELVSSPSGLVIHHSGDVVLEQSLGQPLAQVRSGGDLDLHVPATGTLEAEGQVRTHAEVQADRIVARVILLGPERVCANAIIASERVEIAEGTPLDVALISAPEVRFGDRCTGRVDLLDAHHADQPEAVEGCLDFDAWQASHGDPMPFFESHQITPVATRHPLPSTPPAAQDVPSPSRPPVFTSRSAPPEDAGPSAAAAASVATPPHDDPEEEISVEILASGSVEAILEDDGTIEDLEEMDSAIEELDSQALTSIATPTPKRPPRTRAKHHSQVRRAWERISASYGEGIPEALQSMGHAIETNRTAEVLRRLDEFWANALREHLARQQAPPREVIRAFLAMHSLR